MGHNWIKTKICISINTIILIFHVNLDHTSCCCLVPRSCLTRCDPMDCSMPGSFVLYCLWEFAQIHAVGDASQLSHPLLPSSPFVFILSQHQGLFQVVGSKYWSISFSNSLSKEYSGLIFFRID